MRKILKKAGRKRSEKEPVRKGAKPRWAQGQRKYLLENWEVMTAQAIANHLGKTRWAVINQYRFLTSKQGKC